MNICQSLVWSEFDCIEARAAEYLENQEAKNEKEAFEMACLDSDNPNLEYDDFILEFDPILQKISPSGFFFVEGRNMGWRHLSGHLGISAKDARSFISKAFPKTSEWSLRGSFDDNRKILTFTLSHHDAPTGEFYTVMEGRFCEMRQEIVCAQN